MHPCYGLLSVWQQATKKFHVVILLVVGFFLDGIDIPLLYKIQTSYSQGRVSAQSQSWQIASVAIVWEHDIGGSHCESYLVSALQRQLLADAHTAVTRPSVLDHE